MSKKILSVMLALVLVLSTFAVSAFAAVGVGYEEPNEDEVIENTQVWSLEAAEEADANGYYAVTVSLKTNYDAVSAISFVLNVEGATLVDYVCNIDANADIVADDESGLVNIYPMPDTTDDEAYDFTAGAAVATLYYELNGDSATITLNNDAKCIANPDGKLFAVRSSNGKLAGSAIYGQRIVDAEGADIALEAEIASVTIGVAMLPAELALTEAGATAGVIIDTNKTFGGAYAGVVYGFPQAAANSFTLNSNFITNNVTATNEGTLAITKAQTVGFGTGTTITVKNSDGSAGKVYVVVIFGDIDGNGMVNQQDGTLCKANYNTTDSAAIPKDSPKRMAANCQIMTNVPVIMHTVNQMDGTQIKANYMKANSAFQLNLAKAHYGLNSNYQ